VVQTAQGGVMAYNTVWTIVGVLLIIVLLAWLL
jgi:hypothetical protein